MNTSKELKKMSRSELLELLLEATRENEALRKQVDTLMERLSAKEVLISNAGSIAEASLQLSGIFDAAQRAADIYLLSLKKANGDSEQLIQEAQAEAARIKREAERQSAVLLEAAEHQAAKIRAQSEE